MRLSDVDHQAAILFRIFDAVVVTAPRLRYALEAQDHRLPSMRPMCSETSCGCPGRAKRSFPLKREDTIRILHIPATQKVTALYLPPGRPIRSTRRWQAVLPEADFFRANRQFIVARRAVKGDFRVVRQPSSLSLVLETPERIVISKARVPEFRRGSRPFNPPNRRLTPELRAFDPHCRSVFPVWPYLCIVRGPKRVRLTD